MSINKSSSSLPKKSLLLAHHLSKQELYGSSPWSNILRLSWGITKKEIHLSNSYAKGVTFSNEDGVSRQRILKALSKYPSDVISLSLLPEPDNEFDPHALSIWAGVKDRGSAKIGYVDKNLASIIHLYLMEGFTPIVLFKKVFLNMAYIYSLEFAYGIVDLSYDDPKSIAQINRCDNVVNHECSSKIASL